MEGGGVEHDVTAARRSALPEPQVAQNLLAHGRVLDDGDQAHVAATARATQDVLVPHALEELGPCQPAGAAGIVGAGEVVGAGGLRRETGRRKQVSERTTPGIEQILPREESAPGKLNPCGGRGDPAVEA